MNTNMRRIYSLMLALGMIFALGACGVLNQTSAELTDQSEISGAQIVSGRLPACNPAMLITNDDLFDTLYAISYNRDIDVVQIRVVDPSNAQTLARQTLVSADGIMTDANGLAADPLTGKLWAIVQFQGISGRSLVTLDPVAGTATLIGHLGDEFEELAFDACGRLFGVTGDTANVHAALYVIDKSDASISWLRSFGTSGDGEVIAINPYTNTLYHASGFFSVFERFNITDGTSSHIALSGDYYVVLNSLTFGLSGTAFYSTNINGTMHNISTDGISVLVGQLDRTGIDESEGLAFAPGTLSLGDPEPPNEIPQ